jgi:glutamate decarboxylase
MGVSVDLHDIPYTSRYDVDIELPRFQLPEKGCDAKVAYQLLHDELLLGGWFCAVTVGEARAVLMNAIDGNPNMNLASWVAAILSGWWGVRLIS